MDQLGFGFTGAPYDIRAVTEFATFAEKNGIESFWLAEDYFLRDAISNMACVALATKKIKVSTGIINPFSRNPVLIAETMATLDEIARGRTRLALGMGVKPLMEAMGAGFGFRKPVRAMREAVEIIRGLLAGETVDHHGEFFSVKGVKLGENPYFELTLPKLKPKPIPIYVAAMGPKMLHFAATKTDGVLLTAGLATVNAKETVAKIRASAKTVGRSTRDLLIGCYLITALGKPNSAVRGFVAFDTAFLRPEDLLAAGVPEKKVTAIRETFLKKGIAEASQLVTDDIADAFSACGSKEEIQSKIEEFRKVGVNHPIVLPTGTDVKKLIRVLS